MTARTMTLARREARTGYLWVSPWMIGFLAFTAIPLLGSFALGLTQWNGVGVPKFIGLSNFIHLFGSDPLFWQSLKVTAIFAAIYMPINLAFGFGLALLMNQRLPGMSVLRTIYFVPSILTGVAVAVVWGFIFDKNYGVLNWALGVIHLPAVPWLQSSIWVIPAMVIMQLWGVGGSMLIYLAGIQGVPTEMYEAATLDGAGWWARLWNVTIPMMSPTILFNLVLGLIGTFQIFTQAYIMTGGGPNYGSYFFALNIYDTAFQSLRIGYASAEATVLFIIIVICSTVVFRWSRSWVYYAGRAER